VPVSLSLLAKRERDLVTTVTVLGACTGSAAWETVRTFFDCAGLADPSPVDLEVNVRVLAVLVID
uniref:hypothetical protein n=1 Tax=Noviherbaspirillum sp. TaxID=1926288 RepID=UPI002FE1939D